jgi:putative transposase
MRKSKYSEHQIVGALKRAEAGAPVKDLCRELGISTATFYQWGSKYGGMEASDLKRLKALEEENRRLKQMYVDLSPSALTIFLVPAPLRPDEPFPG